MSTLISIIIPCKEIDSYAKECVDYCKQLNYESFKIVLLPDDTSTEIEDVKVISTGPITPGAKRNIGIANSNGVLCAFLDSDAYPREDWLQNAAKYFEDPDVIAVGGPGLTPDEDPFMQRAGGFVLSSFMVGNLSKRYTSKLVSESDDIHSCNLFVRRSVLLDVGGWDEKYWPGEDTLMSMAINRLGKKMIEAPDVVVYHHRRPLFGQHINQISKFGVHRGFFVKKYKGNSLKLQYFLPSALVLLGFAGGLLSMFNKLIYPIFMMVFVVYLVLCLIVSFVVVNDLKMIPVVWLGIILTHVSYGVSFMIGLFKRDLMR